MLPFPEQSPQDLTRWHPWQRVNEFDYMKPLVVRQLSIRKSQQFLSSNILTRANNDKALRHFATFIIGNTDDGGILIGRMLHEQSLQFSGGNTKTPVPYPISLPLHPLLLSL